MAIRRNTKTFPNKTTRNAKHTQTTAIVAPNSSPISLFLLYKSFTLQIIFFSDFFLITYDFLTLGLIPNINRVTLFVLINSHNKIVMNSANVDITKNLTAMLASH